jgi:hypothetical protein
MEHQVDNLAHLDPTPQLLAELPYQGALGSLPGLDLAARELPAQRKGLVGPPLRQQIPPVALDERGDHEETNRGPGKAWHAAIVAGTAGHAHGQ